MTRRTVIAAALLLTTSVAGVAWAATKLDLVDHHHARDHREGLARSAGDSLTVADNDEHRRKGRHGEGLNRHHDDDDDDDGEGHGRGAGRGMPQKADPNDPTVPVPDNGLFNSKTRPKVEVQ
jgi:hypothetical protein